MPGRKFLEERGVVTPIIVSRTLNQVAGFALLFAAYAGLAVWKEHSRYSDFADTEIEIHSSLSLVLGLLLVFRTNAAYSRWWEARTLWGALVNASRNLAAKLATLTRPRKDEIRFAGQMIISFGHALRNHLRREEATHHLNYQEETDKPEDVTHAPGQQVKQIYRMLGKWNEAEQIDGNEMIVLDRDLARFLDVCGGCERILGTRIARSYRTFARQCVLLFLVTMPWCIVDKYQWWTIPLTGIMAYFMLGLEIVAEHVEEPFGYDDDDLDLEGICNTIERTVNELLPKPS